MRRARKQFPSRLWFAGDYGDKPTNAWGIVTSNDDGATWTQTTVESELPKNQWPTEPSAVYLSAVDADGTRVSFALNTLPENIKGQVFYRERC